MSHATTSSTPEPISAAQLLASGPCEISHMANRVHLEWTVSGSGHNSTRWCGMKQEARLKCYYCVPCCADDVCSTEPVPL